MDQSASPEFKTVRTGVLKALRDQGMGKKEMEIKIMEEVEGFLYEIGKFNEKPFDIADLCHVSVSNIMCSVAFGKRYDYSDETVTDLIGSVVEIFKKPRYFCASNVSTFSTVFT